MPNAGEPLSAVPSEDRPRERLARLGAAALSDSEVLALVIGSGQHGRNVLALSHAILAQAGGFRGLTALNAHQLQRLSGIGPASAGRMVAAVEMCRRAAEPAAGQLLTDPASIAPVVLPELRDREDERFVAVIADRAQRIREIVLLHQGEGGHRRADATAIIQSVLTRGGGSFALAHNHPRGSPEPSVADLVLTRHVAAAARAVGTRFLGHLVVAGDEWRAV